ncbi:MAG: HEAT repeat domain-containing protein [Candidatus Zipacnadales bacterium]
MRINGDTDRLLEELHAANAAERMYALTALAMSNRPEVDQQLIAALSDADRDCRATAARMLGERRSVQAVSALIRALLDSASDIAQEAAEALGKIGDPQAVSPLMQALSGYSAPTRAAAARALGQLGDASAVPALAAALGDMTEAVRAEAAEALGELEAVTAVEPLVQALGDSSDWVRQAAVSALRRLGRPAVEALIRELQAPEPVRRWRAAWALGECSAAPAVRPLIGALQDESETVRAQAALALGSIGDREAVLPLRQATEDMSAAVREAAALSLARLGDKPAPPPLEDTPKGSPPAEGLPANSSVDAAPTTIEQPPLASARPSHHVSLPLLLALVAIAILAAILLLGQIGGYVREQPSPPVLLPAPPSSATSKSLAQLEVARSGWFIDHGRLFVRGQVINSGNGTAANVAVRVVVKDADGAIIGIGERPVSPQRITAGRSGSFTVSVPLPDKMKKPTVFNVQARWDDEISAEASSLESAATPFSR